ncbi:MAG: CoA-binding protein [Candidatus Aenigmatarchaeota archaeon]
MQLLNYFFNPKSIAVIGVSRNPKKFGHIIFKNLLESKFKGKVFAINPNADNILGEKCYPNITDIKENIDLSLILLPSEKVLDAVNDCVKKNVKVCIIFSAGFSEVGNKEDEEKIKDIIRNKMRVIGPNVLGIYDAYSNIDTIFNLRYRQKRPEKGPIAFVSQSGAFGAAIMDWASSENIGFSKFISLGNMIDVDEVDLLEYLMHDNRTKIITLYLEGSKRPRKLFETLKEITKIKPVIVLKAGKTSEGAKAISSHTGSLAGESKLYSALFKQSGTIEANDTEELFDFAKAFYQNLPNGERIQIITDGGGFGIMAADAAIKNGLKLANLSEKNKNEIKKFIPRYAVVENIIDLTGDADTKRYENVLNIVMKDENIDIVLVIILLQISALQSDIVDVINKMKKYNKPLFVCAPGGEFTNLHKNLIEKNGIPVYPTPERAIKAIKALVEYKKYKDKI